MTDMLFRSPLVEALLADAILAIMSWAFVAVGVVEVVSRLGIAVTWSLPVDNGAEAVEE